MLIILKFVAFIYNLCSNIYNIEYHLCYLTIYTIFKHQLLKELLLVKKLSL